MSWTLTTSGACMIKAGANASIGLISGAHLTRWSDETEAFLATDTRYDWVGNYANLKANFKQVLGDIASDMIAMKIVTYDMSGYGSVREATTILDVLRDNIERNLKNLRDDKYREVVI